MSAGNGIEVMPRRHTPSDPHRRPRDCRTASKSGRDATRAAPDPENWGPRRLSSTFDGKALDFRRQPYYLIRSNTLKMGIYRATIIAPMIEPSTAIINGSIRLVSASVVASTSWS